MLYCGFSHAKRECLILKMGGRFRWLSGSFPASMPCNLAAEVKRQVPAGRSCDGSCSSFAVQHACQRQMYMAEVCLWDALKREHRNGAASSLIMQCVAHSMLEVVDAVDLSIAPWIPSTRRRAWVEPHVAAGNQPRGVGCFAGFCK